MSQSQKWGRTSGEERGAESVRTIVKRARPESRILVRRIYREQIEQGVRPAIARLMRRSRGPYTVKDEAKPTRDTASS